MARPRGHKANRAAWEDLANLKGLTPASIAELTNVPRPTVSLLASGINRASLDVTHKIAAAFGVQPATLFPTLSVDYSEADRDEAAA